MMLQLGEQWRRLRDVAGDTRYWINLEGIFHRTQICA
jgi:hypothetical protein